MKIVFFTSVLCIIVGLGLIVGGGIAVPFINSALDNLQTQVSGYLSQANEAVSSAINAINNTQVTLFYLNSATNISLPSLDSSSQLTSSIADNLTSIGSTVAAVGQTLAGISVAGSSPFSSVGNTISSLGSPIQTAASTLQNVSERIGSIREQAADLPNRLESITFQLDNLKASLTSLSQSIMQLQDSISGYFNQIKLVAFLAVAGVMGLGAIFLLIGISLLSLRHKTVEHAAAIYRMYAKDPSLNK
jgi:uncharacterized protein YoxC